jgi:hypothetical protein
MTSGSANVAGFDAAEVFGTLYMKSCGEVSQRLFKSADGTQKLVLPSAFASLMQKALEDQFRHFMSHCDAADHHIQQLRSFKEEWKSIGSESACFSCMMRRPKYMLSCKHWLCDNCYRVFGTKKGVYTYLPKCLLCEAGTGNIRIRLKPDTATPRVLCIDGGGGKAGVPLTIIAELQAKVGLPYPVQHNFDVIFGTSSGMES